MKRAFLLALTVTLVLTIGVGCAGRRPPTAGLSGEANSLVLAITSVLDTIPEDDPRRPQLVAILEQAGKLREKCERAEVYWDLLNKVLAGDAMLNGGGGLSFRIEAGAQ